MACGCKKATRRDRDRVGSMTAAAASAPRYEVILPSGEVEAAEDLLAARRRTRETGGVLRVR